MGLFKITRPDGSVEYTDSPSGPGRLESVRPGSSRQDRDDRSSDYKRARDLIKEAQKRIPKVIDYLDYLDYLRHNRPVRFDQVMSELRREDPQTWIKLQKFPQFRPLRESTVGLKAGSNLLGTGVSLATGNITGGAERWMESTLKDLMKRDRFGPYADVLGAKASTLPSKTPTYTNSSLGQYMKVEGPKLAEASKAAAKDLELANAGMRAARGFAITAPFSTFTDFALGALQPSTGEGALQTLMGRRLDRVSHRNMDIDIDTPAYEQARRLLNLGKYGELDALLKKYE